MNCSTHSSTTNSVNHSALTRSMMSMTTDSTANTVTDQETSAIARGSMAPKRSTTHAVCCEPTVRPAQ